MQKIDINYLAVDALQPASWNPNEVDPINFEKIIRSLEQKGFFKPIIARTLDDGTLEIIGGEHRWKAAKTLGYKEVPVTNLGKLSDKEAKQLLLLDNGRYGEENADKMADLLGEGAGSVDELLALLPIDEEQLNGYFAHESDFDDLNLDDLDKGMDDTIDLGPSKATKTHQIMRFKVPIDDAARISETIQKIRHEQGFSESDDLTNAGDALVYLHSQLDTPENA